MPLLIDCSPINYLRYLLLRSKIGLHKLYIKSIFLTLNRCKLECLAFSQLKLLIPFWINFQAIEKH